MGDIKSVAVIGSGVMGAGIAAHMANADIPVVLFDVVPADATGPNDDRTRIAREAIERLKKSNPAALTHKRRIRLIKPANLEDNLSLLGDVDWIIEVIVEKLEAKQKLYQKINLHRKRNSIVSSNTSTLPLHKLVEGLPKAFHQDFMITHFFNPPRYMRLLEVVAGPETKKDSLQKIKKVADKKLGKGVVDCKDTPGFIANRIGIFWLAKGLLQAVDQKISVEQADLVMSRPLGIPKTGIFGLMDLIGIDLLPLIAKTFSETLPDDDEFLRIYEEPAVITDMIKEGYTGRKGKGGFYRLNEQSGEKIKEVKNLETGGYAAVVRPRLASAQAAKSGLRALFTHEDIGGRYAWSVMRDVLRYSASLIPEISDDIVAVDTAMRLGYNWKYGPFELIDRLGGDDMSGPKWFAEKLREDGFSVPIIIENAGDNQLYKKEAGKKFYIATGGKYEEIKSSPQKWMLDDIKAHNKPVYKNPSVALWDIGDGITCLEFTSKMNSLDPMSLEGMAKSTEIVKNDFRGMVIGNDGDNFSVGANIGVLLFAANVASWSVIGDIIKQGQDTMMGLKYAPFPVVGASSGMALGGGCETLLHCDAIAAHIETYSGLVEVGVGLIPSWGGCKELLYRHLEKRAQADGRVAKLGGMFSFISPIKTLNTMPALEPVFRNVSTAAVSKSAEEARDMMILNDKSVITMNRERLLPDAKSLCIKLAVNYTPPQTHSITLPGKTARAAFEMAIRSFEKAGKTTPHDVVVSKAVAKVLSGGNTDITKEMTEQDMLDLEREIFVEMVRHPDSIARIEHMLETGKPLRN